MAPVLRFVACALAFASLSAASLNSREKEQLARLLHKQNAFRDRRDGHAGKDKVQRVRLDKASVFDVAKRMDKIQAAMETSSLDDVISTSIKNAMSDNTQIIDIIETVADMKMLMKTDFVLAADLEIYKKDLVADVTSTMATTKKKVTDKVKAVTDAAASTAAELTKTVSALESTVAADIKKAKGELSASVTEQLKGTSAIFASLKLSYHANPKIPVFRWAKWETYNNCGTGWFDGNSGEGYGGVAPSSWTDGGHRANQMQSDFKYLRRLFHRHGTSDKFGGTICSHNMLMHSSTNGLMCGVVFRVINKSSNTIRWAPNWRYTSYSGWGEYASASINGQNNFHNGGCSSHNGGCTTTTAFDLPANSNKNRISTIIFISGGSNRYGWGAYYWNNNQLQFKNEALRLPSNLEFVDDLDTVQGSWKQ